jgi:hypothetical protein
VFQKHVGSPADCCYQYLFNTGKINSKRTKYPFTGGYCCCTHFVTLFAFLLESLVLELSLWVFQVARFVGMKHEMYAYILQGNITERDQLKGRKETGVNMAALWGIRCPNVDKTEEADKKLQRHAFMLVHLNLQRFMRQLRDPRGTKRQIYRSAYMQSKPQRTQEVAKANIWTYYGENVSRLERNYTRSFRM